MEASATGTVGAASAFPKYETEVRRSIYLNEATAEIIIIKTRKNMNGKLFL